MSIALTTYWRQYVDQLISSGRYNNQSEVIRAGLRALEERELAGEVRDREDPSPPRCLARPAGQTAATGRARPLHLRALPGRRPHARLREYANRLRSVVFQAGLNAGFCPAPASSGPVCPPVALLLAHCLAARPLPPVHASGAGAKPSKTRHLLFVDTLRQLSQAGATMNENEKQFSFTRAALSTGGRAESKFLSLQPLWAPGCRPTMLPALGQNRQKLGIYCLLTPSARFRRLGPQ